MTEVLSAPHSMEFAYTRSTGPVVGAFLTGLRDRRVLGYKDSEGRVVVPPPEYDASTAAPVDPTTLVEVGQEGTVTTWSWNPVPRLGNPFDRPFAWALVQLDGADTALLHALDAPRDAISTGMRVRVRWAAERVGFVKDIACFEPASDAPVASPPAGEAADPVTGIVTPIRLDYRYTPGAASSQFLRSIKEGRLLGRRCPSCSKVYLPPRGGCPMCGVEFGEEVELKSTGTMVTFAVVNVNFANRVVDLPYVTAEVAFDGADTTTMVLLKGVAPEDARMGMRVRAHWIPEAEWDYSLANIDFVEPIDEPDADYDSYKELL